MAALCRLLDKLPEDMDGLKDLTLERIGAISLGLNHLQLLSAVRY